MEDIWFRIAEVVMLTVSMLFGCLEYLHMLQLESYQLDGYRRWIAGNKGRAYLKGLIVGVLSLLSLLLLSFFAGKRTCFYVAGVTLAASLVAFLLYRRRPAKKKLVLTRRAVRLLTVHFLLWLLVFTGIEFAGNSLPQLRALPFAFPAVWVWALGLSALIAQPMENAINRWYFRDAQKKLRQNPNLIRIGITGSYGKTSTKYILSTILSAKYNVLRTPSSFNTPMGITRVVREKLTKEHEVFIAEMGARHRGDIRELVELVHPSIGLITSVGPQHLETFGSIETVAQTKYELIEGLPEDGIAFFSADNSICEALYEKTKIRKFMAGLNPDSPIHAENITVGPEGSSFDLVTLEETIPCTIPLLGRHNVQNTLLAVSVALQLGFTKEELRLGLSRLTPIEHRLQLIHGAGGVTVIDDAFNANPAGAKSAMDVLSMFPGRRICVTPGMVELGESERELNYEFGRQMARACNIAVLVGIRRTEPIYEGLLAEGFAADDVLRVNTLAQASDFIAKTTRPGDVVLFENDLPDNYDEQ